MIWLLITPLIDAQPNKAGNRSDEEWQDELGQLVEQLGWQNPDLEAGEYEVRVWHRYELVRGAAHSVYVIRKNSHKVTINKYDIRYKGKPTIKHYQSRTDTSQEIWSKLVEKELLTLRTWLDVEAGYYAGFPRDSTWTEVSTDGTVTVKARKFHRRVSVNDGESYAFSVFSHDGSRFYSYSNPLSYYKAYTEIPELRNVTGILIELNQLF